MDKVSLGYQTSMPATKRPVRKSILLAALIGVAAGVFWMTAPIAAFHSYATVPGPWNTFLWVTCPVLRVLQSPAWLVALLNGLLYAAIALCIQFFRKFLRPFAR